LFLFLFSFEFRHAFIEFGSKESVRKAFALHGKTNIPPTVKVGKAHNPIFKDSERRPQEKKPFIL
jgi:hypothetical protein